MSRTPVPFAPETLESIRRAFRIASYRRHDMVSLEHMLHALSEDPQAMDILPKALSLQNIAQYEKDVAEPGAVYADPARRASYLKMYGNICYDTRDRYINFPWSSERK